MIKCPLCKRHTQKGETTGKFRTMVYKDINDQSKGKRIFKERTVCMNCNGENLLK